MCALITEWSTPELDPGTHYIGPTAADANACNCNTVRYSMVSACGLCQNATIISWTSWATNCTSVYISQCVCIAANRAVIV